MRTSLAVAIASTWTLTARRQIVERPARPILDAISPSTAPMEGVSVITLTGNFSMHDYFAPATTVLCQFHSSAALTTPIS